MTANDFGFDVSNTKAQTPFEPLPDGWYAMRIAKAEKLMSKDEANGEMLKLTFEIDENKVPAHAGRRVFKYLCHHHQNQQTREIARAQIAAIFESIGKKGAATLDAMLGAELQVKLKAKPAKDGYEASNEASGFRAPGSAPASGTTAAAHAGNTGTPRAPWKR
jgi:hypothetical protein